MREKLYIKAEKIVLLNKKKIKLKDIIDIYSTNKKIVDELDKEIIINVEDFNKEKKYVLATFELVKNIAKKYPELEIINLGEIEFIVKYEPEIKINKFKEYAKTTFVVLTIFFGSAFAIMAFNFDANANKMFNLVYKLFMLEESKSANIIEISYSIGIPLGTIIFFNHFSKVKIDDDPTPLQIQMRIYEENAYKTIIDNYNRDKANKEKLYKIKEK